MELWEFFHHRNHGYTHSFRSKIIASTRRMKIRTLATPPESNTIQVEKKKTIPLDGATMVKETGRTIFSTSELPKIVDGSRLTNIPAEGCVGFTFRGGVTDKPVKVFYKNHTELEGRGWTTYLVKTKKDNFGY